MANDKKAQNGSFIRVSASNKSHRFSCGLVTPVTLAKSTKQMPYCSLHVITDEPVKMAQTQNLHKLYLNST